MSPHYSPLISAFVTLALTLILSLNKDGTIKDIPNERSLHTEPIPRVGGIAIMAGILSGWVLMIRDWSWWIVLPMLGLFAMSMVDDMRGLTPKTRLMGHFVAASILLLGSSVPLIWVLPVLLFVVWMTNLYNFMDGSDGLAAGMALFGFSMYGFGALMSGKFPTFALMCFSVGGAGLAFLYYNFHPAKVFMGDAGSIPLGFLAAAFGVYGWQADCWPIWFPILVFSPFIVDATFTLLARFRRGEKLSEAHRSHYYQRLVQSGWGHRNTAIVEYIVMGLVGISALWGIKQNTTEVLNLFAWWGAIYLGLSMWVDKRWKQHQAALVSTTSVPPVNE
ncbi:MAG: glycosyltransferase family 4 protein [Gallionella sp.]|nr:glycosyltransferase family 4 protein [Gallionella sp.]